MSKHVLKAFVTPPDVMEKTRDVTVNYSVGEWVYVWHRWGERGGGYVSGLIQTIFGSKATIRLPDWGEEVTVEMRGLLKRRQRQEPIPVAKFVKAQ